MSITLNALSDSIPTKKKRFYGFLIDIIAGLLLVDITISLLFFFFPNIWDYVIKSNLRVFAFYIFVISIYYFLFEGFFHKTIGKFILKMKVVNLNGKKPNLDTIIKRTTSRFWSLYEILVYFMNDYLMHDQISSTIVIDEKVFDELSEIDEIGFASSHEN